MERRQPQLRAGLRPAQPGGQRRVRRDGEPGLRHAAPGRDVRPGELTDGATRDYNWQFSAGVQREVLPRVVGRRRLLPHLVRQLRRHRQPCDRRRRTTTSSASRRRRIRGCPAAAATTIAGLYNVKPERFGGRRTATSPSPRTTASRPSTGTASTSRSMRGRGLTSCFQGGTSTGGPGAPTTARSRRRLTIPARSIATRRRPSSRR